jgi:hypothetical protein
LLVGSMLASVTAVLLGAAPVSAPAPPLPAEVELVMERPGPVEQAVAKGVGSIGALVPGVDLRAQLRTADEVSVSAVAQRGFIRDPASPLHIAPGTRLSVSIGQTSILISTSEPIRWHEPGSFLPEVQIRQIGYDFATAKVWAEASSFGPDSVYSDMVAQRAEPLVRRLLPAAVMAPGYRPSKDPQLERHMARIVDAAMAMAKASASQVTDVSKLSAPGLRMMFTTPGPSSVPIPGTSLAAWIAPRTQFVVTTKSSGDALRARLTELEIRASEPITVGGLQKRPALGLAELKSITVLPEGKLEAEAKLISDTLVEAVAGAVQVIGLATGQLDVGSPGAPSTTPPVIARQLDQEARPRLIAAVRGIDRTIPGFARFFGL